MGTSVSAAFITYQGKILLLRRDDIPTIADPDCWGLIGGHAEDDETPEETLKREVFEEVGVKIENLQFLWDYVDHYGEHCYLYHVELTEDQLKEIKLGDEGQDLRFFSKDEAKNLKLSSGLVRFIKNKPDKAEETARKIGLT